MFNIDKYLEEIKIRDMAPTQALVEKTKLVITTVNRRTQKIKQEAVSLPKIVKTPKTYRRTQRRSGGVLKPLAVLMVTTVLIVAFIMGPNLLSTRVVGAYTVDINPSVCINVDKNDVVVSVTAQNNEAKTLINTLDCVGMDAADAIELIISAAREAGYLDGHEKYVLVGSFSDNKEKDLDDLQQYLEDNLGDMIDLLVVRGTMAEKEEADEMEVSAGLLKLSKMVGEEKLPKDENITDMVGKINETYGYYLAPALRANTTEMGIVFSWSSVGFSSFSYEGKVKYKLYAGKTQAEALDFDGDKVAYYEFYSSDTQPLSHTVWLDTYDINANEPRYYVLYVLYENGVITSSNIVCATMPDNSTDQIAKPTPKPEEEKEEKTETSNYSYDVGGYISGENAMITWDKAQGSGFAGYKLVASKTDSTPAYPENGYLRYITDINVTSKALYDSYQGLKGGTYYYFSVTYVYNDGTKIAGDSVRLKVPDKQNDDPEQPSSPMVSTAILGSLSSTKVNLSWNKVSHEKFSGYKVVMSKTNSSPKYPNDGYISYITNASTTNYSKIFSDLTPGATYYFSITVLYKDGTKKAGNAIALKIPEAEDPVPEEPMGSTNITGSQNGTTVNLSWGKINHEKFSGYKVVASKTNSSPSYPNDGYLQYITSASTTSYSSSAENFEAGKTYYFSITVLYNDGTKKAGNAVAITMPAAVLDPTPEPEPELEKAPYISTSISGSMSGNTVSLNWNKVTHTEFEGYKVVYSFTDSSPVYGERGTSYSHWITSASTTSVSVDITKLSGYSSGATCYFSITVLYDSHRVKKASNAISFVAP